MVVSNDDHFLVGRIEANGDTRANNGRGGMLSALTNKIAKSCVKCVAEWYESGKACHNSNYKW